MDKKERKMHSEFSKHMVFSAEYTLKQNVHHK